MARKVKSLQEFERAFHEQYKAESLQEDKYYKEKTLRIELISDIICCIALAGAGLSALFLSVGEKNGYSGRIYTAFNNNRGIILMIFFTLIISSLFLKFIGNRKENTIRDNRVDNIDYMQELQSEVKGMQKK